MKNEIKIKTKEEIEIMRETCGILSGVMKQLLPFAREHVTTEVLDQLAEGMIYNYKVGATPGFKGHDHYPFTICTSINEELVHTFPSRRTLKNGDIISIDCGVKYKEYHSDMAVTIPVGKVPRKTKKLIQTTKGTLDIAIKNMKDGVYWGDIAHLMQSYVEKNGFSVVRQFSGHGIGKELHEQPRPFNYGEKGTGPILKEGMVLAIEPMVNMGKWPVQVNKGAAVTIDGSLSAHFEHTILVTKDGCEVLTKM